jgi:lysyl-tRNA synthetase class 1
MTWIEKILNDLNRLKKDKFLVSDYKTPSGKIHVGALRGVFIHDAVYRALVKEGKKAEFIYGFDDFDPMDSLPVYLDKNIYESEMGKPLSNVPSPEKGYQSFAEYYAKDFIEVFEKCGAKPKIIWLSDEYRNGKFDAVIKEILENAEAIRKIYKKVSGSIKEKDWLPISMVCEKCGKIGTTFATKLKRNEVYYECKEDYVKWAKGCGYKGKASPYKGGAKLPWKVEWAAKWKVYGTDVEGAGKDHSTAGGARDIAWAIAIGILKIKEPYNIPYEWFLVEGKKMSTSKGVGATAREMLDILPPEVLRFLILRTPPGRAIDFKAEGEAIPQLFDDYDKVNPGAVLSFRKVVFGLQMPKIDILGLAQAEKGDKLTETEEDELKERVHYAKIWLKRFAPERYVFKVLPKMPQEAKKLTAAQKEFLAEIKKIMEGENKITGDELHSEIHNLKIQMRIDPREAFSAIYLIFLGKDSGPQAGWFLASLDKDFVIKRISEAIK